MLNLKSNKGITMIVLVVMVIIVAIIASITVYYGTDYIEELKLEGIQTNMISIRAKAKGIAEKVNAEIWTETEENKKEKRKEIYLNNYNMEFVVDEPEGVKQSELYSKDHECYKVTKEALEKMSLGDIVEDEELIFYVIYDSSDYTNLDIVYETGIEYRGNMYYSLSKMQEGLEENNN